jgi:hypothetical protein
MTWNGLNDKGEKVSSGVYFAVARTESATYRAKAVLIE